MADFTLPAGAMLLGASPLSLAIRGEGVRCILRLGDEGQRQLAAAFPEALHRASQDQVYLLLENIRGTRDATVLNVYINLPAGENPGPYPQRLAGSAGLFGLRMASLRYEENPGEGLTFLFDVTTQVREQVAAQPGPVAEIHLSIWPDTPLPDSSDLVVGRVSLYRIPSD